MKILATQQAPFEFTVPEGVTVVEFDENDEIPTEHLDADAAVVVGGTSPAVQQLAREASNLRWVQALAAGPDGVLAAGFDPKVTITTGTGLHTKTVAEMTVALILNGLYRFGAMHDFQGEKRWDQNEFGGWRKVQPEGKVGSLIDANVLIWGFGAIGQQIGRIVDAIGGRVRGVANSAGERSGFEVFTDADLPTLLPETDVLIMVLPTSPATDRALNAERMDLLPDRAWVVNVGRGSTVDQDALIAALHDGTLGGAALDVVDPEPYPADGALWDAPNVIITPHIAGGRAHGSDELINENITRLQAGEALRNAVSR